MKNDISTVSQAAKFNKKGNWNREYQTGRNHGKTATTLLIFISV